MGTLFLLFRNFGPSRQFMGWRVKVRGFERELLATLDFPKL